MANIGRANQYCVWKCIMAACFVTHSGKTREI
uniref:Uncharacterized protein n=1 Tax=Anguilla anguilla TaxID=7936 RepID=A0A0E9QPZ2_ANGAN